jgi:hypothetical protein
MRIAMSLALVASLATSSPGLADDELAPAPPGPWQTPPRLGKPEGGYVRVHSEPQLQNAVQKLRSGTTILIEPGTYQLTNTVHITGGVKHVTIRGATDDRAAVVLKGPGMSNKDHGNVPHGIMISNATDVTIANLSVGDVWYHPITLQGPSGCKRVRILNVRLFDAGEQFLKANPDNRGGGVDDCTVEYCVFEYTDRARHNYTQGMSVHTAANWTVRNNLFRNIRGPRDDPRVGGCIDFWHGSRNATVEGNVIVNCRMGIRFGIIDRMKERGTHDNEGGMIRNNIIWRQPGAVEAPDDGILVWDSPHTKVLHNTVLLNGTFPAGAIEYRWCDGVVVANNLTDARIWKREVAGALEENNVVTANQVIFANAAAGDLRLAPKARSILPGVMALADCPVDIWGKKRSSRTNVGADELRSVAP